MNETTATLLGIIVIAILWTGWPLARIASALEALQAMAEKNDRSKS